MSAETLLQAIEGVSMQDVRGELKKLGAIREWAIKQVCNFSAGDKVAITESLTIESSSGWWGYREALAPGAVGTANGIDFNDHYGYWYAAFVPDREWSVSEWGETTHRYWHGPVADTPEGYEPPSKYDAELHPDGRRHTFWIPVRHLRAVTS